MDVEDGIEETGTLVRRLMQSYKENYGGLKKGGVKKSNEIQEKKGEEGKHKSQ